VTDKTLDLLVRAQIQGGKDLEGVAKSISKIGDAIDEQNDAAKRGENRIDELKASLLALEQVQKSLAGQSSAVKTFQKLAEGVGKVDERVAKATKRYDEYKKKLDEAKNVTEAQQNTLIRYALAVEKSEAALRKQRSALSDMEAEFRDAGIAVEGLAARQQRSLQLQAELGVVYARGTDAVQDYSNAVRKAREAQRAVDASTAEAARNAELFAKAEKRAADASRERARAAEEVAEALRRRQAIRADRDAEVVAQGRGDDEFRAQVKRQAELAALRRDIEQRSSTDAEVKAYRATAKAADENTKALTKLARGKNTLDRAAVSLTPKVGSLRDAIAGVLDPTAKARTTISGLESEVGDLAAAVGAIKGPVTDYRVQIDRLTAAQKTLSNQAGLVDTYNRQVVALRNSRAAFVQARASVIEYSAKVAQGGDGAAQFGQKLAQAQGQLRTASQALSAQIAVTRQSRDGLRDAGIATNDLVGAQRRLNDVAKSTVTSMKALDTATDRYGQSVKKAKNEKSLFRDEGRTTLNLMQRIRGEVLSLTAAYVGLFGVINTAKGAIQSTVDKQAIESRIAVAIGDNDTAKIGKEYDYLRDRAEYYGIGIKGLATSYGSFAVAAKSANYTNDQTKYTFEQLTAAMRVMKLNTDQSGRAFVQIQQILSKTKPEMEDIKTIAESGFAGVQGLMARGLLSIGVAGIRAGKETGDMFALMRKGALDSNTAIYALAVQAEKELGGRVPEAIKTLAAEQGRFETSVFEFQQAIAESGWADAYKNTLIELSKLMRSEDGSKAAKNLGNLFTALAEALIWVAKNSDLVLKVLTAIALWYSQGVVLKAVSNIRAWGAEFARLAVVVQTTLIPALAKAGYSVVSLAAKWPLLTAAVLGSLGVITAAFAGWQIGTYAREKFQIVRDAGIWWATRAQEAFVIVKNSFAAAIDALPEYAKRAFAKVVTTIADAARGLTGIFSNLARAAGFDSLADTLDKAADSMTVATRNEIDVLANHKANLKRELAQIAAIREDMLSEPMAGAVTTTTANVTGRVVASPTTIPGRPVNPLGGDGDAAGIAKRQTEIAAIERALEAIEAKTDRAQTDSLAKQIEAIDTQYLALARRVEALGGDTGKVFMERLTAATNELKRVTTEKFNADLLAAQQGFLKKTEDMEEQAGRREKLKLDSRLAAIVSDYDQAYRELAELRLKFFANNRDTGELDAMAGRLKLSKDQRLEQETNKFNTEELNRREQFLNDTIAAREKLVSAVNVQKEIGNISDVEAAQQINDINGQMVPKIEAAALATQEWAIANSAIFANPEQMQVFLATLEAVRAKATGVKTEFSNLNNTIINGLTNGVTTGLNAMFDALQQVATGQATVGEGFRGMLMSFAQFAVSFLRDIAIMIIKLAIFNAMKNSGIPGVSQAGALGAASMGVKHSGGVIGGLNNRSRTVSTAWFANAPRYHTGGIAGLSPDEYPTILQKGEEVLEKDSPRNVLNGGAGMGQNAQAGGNTRFVLVDDRARVPEAMSSAEGERVIIQTLRKNIPTLKQYLK
jgi:chromosome segregation ATPase